MTNKALNEQIAEQMFALSRVMKEEMTFDSDTAQLTILQLQALIFIKRNGEVTMTEVATQFGISLPTATALSNKLVSGKFIKRVNDATDRRIVKLILTPKGDEMLQTAMKQRNAKINTMLSYMSQREKEQLLKIMNNLVTNIQKQ